MTMKQTVETNMGKYNTHDKNQVESRIMSEL